MAENNVFARPYAKAAFEHGVSDDTLEQWNSMLELASIIVEDSSVKFLLQDPSVEAEQIIDVILNIDASVFNESGQNFIRVLANFERLQYLPEIFSLFSEYKTQYERSIRVELISAKPISSELEQKFCKALEARLLRKVHLECGVDPKLIAGAKIRAGDLVIDGSAKGRVAQLREAVGV